MKKYCTRGIKGIHLLCIDHKIAQKSMEEVYEGAKGMHMSH